MPRVGSMDLKILRETQRLNGGDVVVIDTMGEKLTREKYERIAVVAKELYEIIDTSKDLVWLIQIGPLSNIYEESYEEEGKGERT